MNENAVNELAGFLESLSRLAGDLFLKVKAMESMLESHPELHREYQKQLKAWTDANWQSSTQGTAGSLGRLRSALLQQ